MTSPAIPGAINIASLTGNEVVPIHPKGQGVAQTTTGAIAGLSPTGPTGPTGTTGPTGPTGTTGPTGPSGLRARLVADTNYYVATTGSDTTGDGSIAKPWATAQHAVNWIAENVDGIGLYGAIVNLGTGSFQGVGMPSMPNVLFISMVGNGSSNTTMLSGNDDLLLSFGDCIDMLYPVGATVAANKLAFANDIGAEALYILGSYNSFLFGNPRDVDTVDIKIVGNADDSITVQEAARLVARPGLITIDNTGISNKSSEIYMIHAAQVEVAAVITVVSSPSYDDSFLYLDKGVSASFAAINGSVTGIQANVTQGSHLRHGAIPGSGLIVDTSSTANDVYGPIPSSGTATASASAATLNTPSGVITSQALTTATTFTLTLTNSLITAASVVIVNPTNSAGTVTNLLSVTPSSGQVIVAVSMASLTGTVQIAFQVLN